MPMHCAVDVPIGAIRCSYAYSVAEDSGSTAPRMLTCAADARNFSAGAPVWALQGVRAGAPHRASGNRPHPRGVASPATYRIASQPASLITRQLSRRQHSLLPSAPSSESQSLPPHGLTRRSAAPALTVVAGSCSTPPLLSSSRTSCRAGTPGMSRRAGRWAG